MARPTSRLRFFPGNGFNPGRSCPARARALVVLGVTLLVARRRGGALGARPAPDRPPPAGLMLLVLVAVATPLGLLLFSARRGQRLASRATSARPFPPVALLLGGAAREGAEAAGLAAALSCSSCSARARPRSYETSFARADYKGAARYLESAVARATWWWSSLCSRSRGNRFRHVSPIDLNFESEHPVVIGPLSGGRARVPQPAPPAAGCSWPASDYGAVPSAAAPGAEEGLWRCGRVEFNGFVAVFAYERAVTAGQTHRATAGRHGELC